MNSVVFVISILLPIVGAMLIPVIPFKTRWRMFLYMEALCIATSILVVACLFQSPTEAFTLFRFSGNLSVTFRLDGPGRLFCGIAAIMWPLAVLYSYEYMKHEERETSFFLFYIVTYGVTLGIAMAENILTMYFFFEMMSLVTLPLILHTRTREAILASRTYLYYMLGGAAFAFIGMIFVLSYGVCPDFIPGGVMDLNKIGDKTNLLLLVYVFSFFGFGIKTAVFPFSGWLPKAGVAPTPVTALLHAVAVVNAGAFAVMRITYYSFGASLLYGSWAQRVVLVFVIFTIVYGCSRGLKETHLKRRLAWSTVSNLSYILFGIVLMTPEGLVGGLCHMLFHSFMKITSFFCAGAVIYKTGKNYIHELNGFGRRMPRVFLIFTVSAMALMGVPGLAGFISKWQLVKAGMNSGLGLGMAGIAALLISALLTAMYMLNISVRAFFPGKEFDDRTIQGVQDPNGFMLIPLLIFVVLVVCFGMHSQPVIQYLTEIANGI